MPWSAERCSARGGSPIRRRRSRCTSNVSRAWLEVMVEGLILRRMTEADLDAVMAIEEASFASPWSRTGFENELTKEYGAPLVAETGGEIVGYLIRWMIVDEVHIANIAVHPEYRRRGIARAMMEDSLSRTEGFRWVGLEVRDGNEAALGLYEALGFRRLGVREKYYEQENADAILMIKELD